MSTGLMIPPAAGQLPADNSFLGRVRTMDGRKGEARSIAEAMSQRVQMAVGQQDPQFLMAVAECARFVQNVVEGRRTVAELQEAMTSSDFPLLLANVMYKKLVGYYEAYPTTFRNYLAVDSVNDFKEYARRFTDGARGLLTKKGGDGVPGKDRSYTEDGWTVRPYVYEDFLRFSWELFQNDDLRAFRNAPRDLGFAAARTEEWFATTLFCDASGPHASMFSVGNNNIIPGNPALSVSAIKTGLTKLWKQVDSSGLPVMINGVHVVVGPGLQATLLDIMEGMQVMIMNENRASNLNVGQNLTTSNWVGKTMKGHMNSMVPIVASSANGDTSWWIFADPVLSTRPAAEVVFLRGLEQPALLKKKSNIESVAGGMTEALSMGDFDTGSIDYKVVHALGGAVADPKFAVGSNGSGS